MEDRGFDIIPCSLANPSLIAAAKAEFQVALQASRKESPELSCVAIKEFGLNCRELFFCGVEVSLILKKGTMLVLLTPKSWPQMNSLPAAAVPTKMQ